MHMYVCVRMCMRSYVRIVRLIKEDKRHGSVAGDVERERETPA